MMQYQIELALEAMRYGIPNLTDKPRYLNIHNRSVPSVTEIIHKTNHNDSLMYWANSIGLKGVHYTTYTKQAASIGTYAHACIEKYIKHKEKTESNVPFMGFMAWYQNLIDSGNQVDILFSELKCTCLWFGGTADMLISINGKVYLVDFKTSNRISYNYFIQLAAYKYLIEKEMNVIIDGGLIVLQLNKTEPIYSEYILVFEIPAHYKFMETCTVTFLSMVYLYYHLVDTDNRFHGIFKRSQGGIV